MYVLETSSLSKGNLLLLTQTQTESILGLFAHTLALAIAVAICHRCHHYCHHCCHCLPLPSLSAITIAVCCHHCHHCLPSLSAIAIAIAIAVYCCLCHHCLPLPWLLLSAMAMAIAICYHHGYLLLPWLSAVTMAVCHCCGCLPLPWLSAITMAVTMAVTITITNAIAVAIAIAIRLHHREGIVGLSPCLELCERTWIGVGVPQVLFLCLCPHMALARFLQVQRHNSLRGSWGVSWKVACCFPSAQQCWFQEEGDSSIEGQTMPLRRLQTCLHVIKFRTKFQGSSKLPSSLH
jgi:hypothetical protein